MSNLASRLAASESASSTILAKDRTLSCDTRQTGLNNNALVIGPSGAGKTRNVLKPNLLQMNASYIVLDTKGTLCREVGPVLAAHGYRVQCLNFADLNTVPALAPGTERCGYNPLRHMRRKADGRPNQQDILSVAKAICPIEDNNQPFWDHAAANLLSCLIAYVTEQLPADEQTISSVIKLIEHLQDGATARLFDDLITTDPQSYALSLWRRYAITQNAERMHASIVGILAEKVMCLGFDGAAQLYRECHQVDFASMGHTPCALFVTVSDIDRNLDPLTGLFISQAFMGLIREADRQPDGSLPVPVRFMLDDFANLQIPPDRQRALDYPKPQHLGNAAAAVDQPARCALWRGTRTLHHGQLRHASGAGVPGSRECPGVFRPRRRAAQHAHGDADRSLVALCTRSHSRTGRAL